MRKFLTISLFGLLLLSAACGSHATADTGKVIKSAQADNNLTVTLSNEAGALKQGDEEFTLTLKDASGKPVEAGAVALNFLMPAMGTMSAMSSQTTFTTTDTPGVYRGKAQIEMSGEWQAHVTYEGPTGRGRTSFPVTVQ